MNLTPTLGRIVLLVLTASQAAEINRRRTTGSEIHHKLEAGTWPAGAQAHIGNVVNAGDTYPAIVVRCWTDDMVNLQVLLDGNDTYWATSVHESHQPNAGFWHWPPRV